MSLTASALWLAEEMRLPVFACGSDKRPVTQHGFHDATRDPAEIRTQFGTPGAAMIGVPTGQGAGFFVVDLDVKNGGQGLEWLAANQHRLPRTRTHKTRSGGQHLLFQWPEGRTVRNSASRIAPGVDVRGNGGYIIAPPSPDYEIADHSALAEAPAWLLALIDPPVTQAQAVSQAMAPRQLSEPRQSGDGTRYGMQALDNECQAILSAADGAKHDTLNRAAFSIGGLVAAGELAEGPAMQALASALAGIASRCEDYPAAQKTLGAAFRAGMAKPREAPPRLIRRVVEEYAPTRPEPPPLTEAPEHWGADPDLEPDLIQVERVAPDIKATGLPLVYFGDIKPALTGDDFVEGLLIRAAMSVIYGPSNCGKTFLMADLALHVALGWKWWGRDVTQGAVIYCALEGAFGIRNRVAAFALHHGLDGQDIPFAIIPVALNILNPEADTDRLIAAIEEAAGKLGMPVALVVMDTLSRAIAGGNENSPEDMGRLVANSDKIRQVTGAHIAWVHHSGKDQALGARGHSLLRAATDTEIEISRPDADSPSTARVTKQRELEIEGTFTFSLHRVELGLNQRGKPVTSCVVEPAEEGFVKSRVSLSNNERMALRILHDTLAKRGREPSHDVPPGVQLVCTMAEWRAEYSARSTADSADTKAKAFKRAAASLSEKQQIGVIYDLVWPVHA